MSNSYFGRLGWRPAALGIFFALAGGLAVFYLALRWEVEPVYVIAIVTLVPFSLFAMQKWPLVILVGMLFVGELKTSPAAGISLTDPTMIFLLLLSGAIFWGILLMLAPSARSLSFSALFKGQIAISMLFLLFCAVMAISLLYTRSEQGAMKVARFETFEVLVFFAPLLFLKNKKDVRQLLIAVVVVGIMLSIRVIMD